VIFAVQKFVEEHLERRGFADVDDYAIHAANAFERAGGGSTQEAVTRQLARSRTTFFRRNASLDRREFEARLAQLLRRRFQKKNSNDFADFRQSLSPARRRIRSRRRSINTLLREFRVAVEARAIDSFWISRKKNHLRSKPETIAQGLLAVFAKAVVGDTGLVLREFASGIGFVDVGISFGGPLHLIEIKMLSGKLTGANQLMTYMAREQRGTGWLLLIDTRGHATRSGVPPTIATPSGVVRTMVIDVNPIPPHLA
jgi:hypothetical protein